MFAERDLRPDLQGEWETKYSPFVSLHDPGRRPDIIIIRPSEIDLDYQGYWPDRVQVARPAQLNIPVGLVNLLSTLADRGYNPGILYTEDLLAEDEDGQKHPLYPLEVARLIVSSGVPIVGLSLMSDSDLPFAKAVADMIKQMAVESNLPCPQIIAGGRPITTINPSRIAARLGIPADMVFGKDEVNRCLTLLGSSYRVNGLGWPVSSSSGLLRVPGVTPRNVTAYMQVLEQGGMGCFGVPCNYCAAYDGEAKTEINPGYSILALNSLWNSGIREVHLINNMINIANVAVLNSLRNIFLSPSYFFAWDCFTHPSIVVNQALTLDGLKTLTHSGLVSVFMGIESGSPAILSEMNRAVAKNNPQQYLENTIVAANKLAQAQIMQNWSTILGYPFLEDGGGLGIEADRETVSHLIKMLDETHYERFAGIEPVTIHMCPLVLYDGSQLHKLALEKGATVEEIERINALIAREWYGAYQSVLAGTSGLVEVLRSDPKKIEPLLELAEQNRQSLRELMNRGSRI